MVYVHIVLVKVKAQVRANGYEEFKARLETLRDLQVTKDEAVQVKWGPPIWDTRTQGFDYGLYSVFRTREGLQRYKDDNDHKEYVAYCGAALTVSFAKMNLIPNVDDVSRGYADGATAREMGSRRDTLGSTHFRSATDTFHDVKSSAGSWARTATMPSHVVPHGAGDAPALSDARVFSRWSSDTDTLSAFSVNGADALSLKRGAAEPDADSILGSCFDDSDVLMAPDEAPQSNRENEPWHAATPRTLRPLPSRGGLRPSMSMPPLQELPASYDSMHNKSPPGDAAAVEPFRQVDFSTYAERMDGF
ncbi:hypothetical protein MSPP1_003547 [Malassezia sp. CBS 17886]|nr:hypothetical protein MSPP1_003547 [Malassezia sp. CBS 17886]